MLKLLSGALVSLLVCAPFNAAARADSPAISAPARAAGPQALFDGGTTLLAQKTPESLRAALLAFQQAFAAWQTAGDEPKEIAALLSIARTQFLLQDPGSCRTTLDQARQLSAGAHDTLTQAKVTDAYALLDDAEKNEAAALQEASRSAELFHAARSPLDEAAVLSWLAAAYQKAGDQSDTTATFERLIPVAAALKDPAFQALIRLRLAQQYDLEPSAAARKQSLALLAQALPYFEAAPTGRSGAIADLWATGSANDYLNDFEAARTAYARALSLAGDSKDQSTYGRLAANLGTEEVHLKLWAPALAHLETALPLLTAPADTAERFVVEIDLGTTREALDDPAGALRSYALAAADSRRAGDGASEATSWLKAADVYAKSYDWTDAIDAGTKAVAAARSPGGSSMLPSALLVLGGEYLNDGQQQRSLDIGLQALPLLHGNDRLNELIAIGINYSWLGQYSKALADLNLGLSESSPHTAERAGLKAVLAEVHTSLVQLDAALDEAGEARAIFHDLHMPKGEAKALNQLGLVYEAIGDKRKSEAALTTALANERANGNLFGECATLNNLGDLQRYFGDFEQAEPLYEQALAVATQIADRYQQASILQNLGLAQHGLGRESDALASLRRALDLRRALADPESEAKVLSSIGMVDIDIGDPQAGLDALLEGLAKLQNSDDIATRASVLDDLGYAYRYLGAYDDAATYLKQAQALALNNYKDSRATVEGNLASLELHRALTPGHSAEFKQDGLDKAAALYADVLPAIEQTADRVGQTIVLNSQAVIASEQGKQPEALAILARAQKLAAQTGNVDTQALVEHTAGTVYARLGDGPAALRHYAVALPLWRKIGQIDGQEQTLFVMAKAEREEGKLDRALADVEQAIALSSDVRARVTSDERRASIFAAAGTYYEFEIDLLMQLARQFPGRGYEAQAFEACERGRARSLLDLLAESRAELRRGVDPQLLDEERSVQRALAAKEAVRGRLAPAAGTQPEQSQLQAEIAALGSRYELVEAKIRAVSPGYAALTQPTPLTVEEIQAKLLDADTVLLEYSLGQDRSYLWAVTRAGVSAYELPPRAQIEDAAGDLFRLIGEKDAVNAAQAAEQLSRMLLAPAARDLKYRIVVVADGDLQRTVPFGILPEPQSSGADLLLAHHEVVAEPSASVIGVLRQNTAGRPRPPKLLAVVADPVFGPDDDRLRRAGQPAAPSSGQPPVAQGLQRLPNSGAEAHAILALGDPQRELSLMGFDANKATVLATKLADYRILHFATHGTVDNEHPALSGLALSFYDPRGSPIDGLLTLNDVYNLELPVDLVVLSACESGNGEVVPGEGIMGLTRGFMYAGARSVLVSMWNVNDRSTAELMQRFYRAFLSAGGAHPAAALRAAQLSMLGDKQWNEPYYWAAFTLQGDWR